MDYTKIILSRGERIENSRSIAILHLDLHEFSPGEAAIVNYYTDERKNKVDTIFAVGIKFGSGRDCYRVISTGQFTLIWDIVTDMSEVDISGLTHQEVYLYHDLNNDSWYSVYKDSNSNERIKSPILSACTYICLKDNNLYISGDSGKVKKVNDLATEQDIERIIEIGGADYSIEEVDDPSELPENALTAYKLKRTIGENLEEFRGDTIIIPKQTEFEINEGAGISIENNSTISVKLEEQGSIEVGDNGGLQINGITEEQLSQSLQALLSDLKRKFYSINVTATRTGNTIYFTDEQILDIAFYITVKNNDNELIRQENENLTIVPNQPGSVNYDINGYSARYIPDSFPQETTTYTFTATYQSSVGPVSGSKSVNVTFETTPFYIGTVNKAYSNNLIPDNVSSCTNYLLNHSVRNHNSIKPEQTGDIETSITDNNTVNDTLAILSPYRIIKFIDAKTGFESDSSAFSEAETRIDDTNGVSTKYYLYVKNTLSTGTINYKLIYGTTN